ncbi:phosphatidylinositol 3,4,5-trisphosphate 3-phosphatase TPTE2-like isoform X11 [Macaca thibetana thibetana]|uniref:phosphatidylinositol 3,4,5-trisphosphate 3-phosphatase TPTE2-like isoform X7 n=1 Tax=Macaca thibetana thibetana TaxID=257877 RepID=UPI0021BC95AE|nr:phosphatidylinositol 3,4,5-trisphosphate 3-phosphatase TPTE2-like isoform X7 [Macaca thibetana thibetana]XP_050622253.1 phosphatidylinositol 3,4,5-trisphosphate 3-phosphatase TPTE2-like isoform X8 [Macaca thibetana thibetana]XP_050622254.1 phosphatidylinositol 3,4,5-trisphosphate 3-phosphatase TPTE2-like isoform X9 [Macaca thibetana thibetana]XP_050622255.1 phosphatidylinositol 3,4,5-trisphosphate 3-phosphatase TPTE2-like isoform X10 [Macaca thibetana thibetana]XP_050622256.1 phosphatidylino
MDSLTVSTITASDNYDHNGPYPNDLAGVIIDRPTDDSPPTNELTTANPEARINESPHPDDLVEVVIDTDTDDIPHTRELTGGTKEACIYESVSERLSRFEDYENAEYVASYDNKIKKIVHSIVSSFAIGIFGVFLVLLDVALIFADLIFTDSNVYIPLEYRSISLAIALFFLMDVLLRVFVEGRQHYFSDLLNILDTAITVIILLVDVIYIFFDVKFLKDVPRWTRLFRLLRLIILIRVFHLAHLKRQLGKLIRRLVSGNKRRYKRDGFDLDLTYITERIIAMSFPSSGGQSFYRNPIKEVVQFLDKKHPNHYRVYNLCSERAYDPKHFHNRVSRIMIDDHNVPTLWEMVAFSKEVEEWLAQDPENIIVIHCKGGKGRTGTMVCACLIATEIFLTAEESLYYFGERRTDKTNGTKYQGVETPSQNRYVGYFAQVKHSYNWNLPPRKTLFIKRFVIYSIHGVGTGDGYDLKVQIVMKKKIVFSCTSLNNCRVFHDTETDRVIIDVFNCPPLYDDVKVQVSSSDFPKYYHNYPFFFWFNTSLIQNNRLYLQRNELDNLHKQKTWKMYQPQYAVETYFDEK